MWQIIGQVFDKSIPALAGARGGRPRREAAAEHEGADEDEDDQEGVDDAGVGRDQVSLVLMVRGRRLGGQEAGGEGEGGHYFFLGGGECVAEFGKLDDALFVVGG